MAIKNATTSFITIYDSFWGRVTDDMFLELTELDTLEMLQDLLINSLPRFEFPRFDVFDYELGTWQDLGTYQGADSDNKEVPVSGWVGGTFNYGLTDEEINIIALNMVIEWLAQQLDTTENTREKFSGSDFKFTSQANHMAKLKVLIDAQKQDSVHLQRIYKRRRFTADGAQSTMGDIITKPLYAAAGQQIQAPTAAMSSATAAGASGPMQAKKDTDAMAASYRGVGNADTPASSILNSAVGTANAYHTIGDTAHSPSGFSKVMKNGTPHIATLQHGLNTASKFTDTHIARFDPKVVEKGETWGATPAASAISGGLGVITGGMNAYTGFSSMIRNLRNLKAGASKTDALEGGLQMLAGVGGIGSGGASIAKVVSSAAADALKVGGGLQDLVPGLSIATGGVNAILGGIQAARGGSRWKEINEQIGSIVPEGPQGSLTDDQRMMLRTMRHGKEIQKRNTILGGTKALGGALSAVGGFLSLGGVTSAAGLGLSAAGALVNGIGSIYNIFKNRRLRKNAIAEEYGGKSYTQILKDVRESVGNGKYISRSKAWEIFLKSKGVANTSEDDLYADIRKRRAAHMLHMAAAGDDTATAFIESMGVKQAAQTASGSPTFAEGALDLLAEKLK